jgi:selenocysteine lyase/cysteine desulfurase
MIAKEQLQGITMRDLELKKHSDPVLESARMAAEVYANVHRGTGHFSLFSTHLYETARKIMVEFSGFDFRTHTAVFCSPLCAADLLAQLSRRLTVDNHRVISSEDVGLALGLRCLVLPKKILRGLRPLQPGGGTVKMVSRNTTLWAAPPERFEPGTPAVLNVITFVRAFQQVKITGQTRSSTDGFSDLTVDALFSGDDLKGLSGKALLDVLRETLHGSHFSVSTRNGNKKHINLDNAASTPAFEPVWQVYARSLQMPKPVQKELVDQSRLICSNFFNAPAAEFDLYFTTNTTEAANIVARYFPRAAQLDEPQGFTVVNTVLEHNSNELPWREIEGVEMVRLDVDDLGYIDLAALEAVLFRHNAPGSSLKPVRIVAISGASNVLGTCNDLPAISQLAHRYHAFVVVDGAQLTAHKPVRMAEWGIDFLLVSAHKAYAPFGSGALIARRSAFPLPEWQRADIQAAGDENAAGIAAFGKTLLLLERIGLDVIEAEEQRLLHYTLSELRKVDGVTVYGLSDPNAAGQACRTGVIVFSSDTVPHNLAALELAEIGGFGVRNGCFCAHLLIKQILKIASWRLRLAELGLIFLPDFTAKVLPGMVRVSFGLGNHETDVDALMETLRQMQMIPRTGWQRFLGRTRNGTHRLPRTMTGREMHRMAERIAEDVFGIEKLIHNRQEKA